MGLGALTTSAPHDPESFRFSSDFLLCLGLGEEAWQESAGVAQRATAHSQDQLVLILFAPAWLSELGGPGL